MITFYHLCGVYTDLGMHVYLIIWERFRIADIGLRIFSYHRLSVKLQCI